MNIVVKGVIEEKIFFNVYKNRKKDYFMFINAKKYNTSLTWLKIIIINRITSLHSHIIVHSETIEKFYK